MDKIYRSTGTTITFGPRCNHGTGWFMTAEIWIFSKQYFVCSDCGKSMEMKVYEEFIKERKK